jgi:hypothetical protein
MCRGWNKRVQPGVLPRNDAEGSQGQLGRSESHRVTPARADSAAPPLPSGRVVLSEPGGLGVHEFVEDCATMYRGV